MRKRFMGKEFSWQTEWNASEWYTRSSRSKMERLNEIFAIVISALRG
jgi:hypothetical protein